MRIDIPSSASGSLQRRPVGMYNGHPRGQRRLDVAMVLIWSVTVALVSLLVINVLMPPF